MRVNTNTDNIHIIFSHIYCLLHPCVVSYIIRGSSLDLGLKLRLNYFCTYQFPPGKSTRNRQTSLNPNVDKSLTPRHQSHPRALTLSLLVRLQPPQCISEQFLRPIHGNPCYSHSYLLIFGVGLRSAHKHEIRTGPRLASAYK